MVRKLLLVLVAGALCAAPIAARAEDANPVDWFCATGQVSWTLNSRAAGHVLGFDYLADPEKCYANHNFQVRHVVVTPATQWLVYGASGYRFTDPGTVTTGGVVEAAGYLVSNGDRQTQWVATVVALRETRPFPSGDVVVRWTTTTDSSVHIDGSLVPDHKFGVPLQAGPGQITADISCPPAAEPSLTWTYRDRYGALTGTGGGPFLFLDVRAGEGDWANYSQPDRPPGYPPYGRLGLDATSMCPTVQSSLAVPVPPGTAIGAMNLYVAPTQTPPVPWLHFPEVPDAR